MVENVEVKTIMALVYLPAGVYNDLDDLVADEACLLSLCLRKHMWFCTAISIPAPHGRDRGTERVIGSLDPSPWTSSSCNSLCSAQEPRWWTDNRPLASCTSAYWIRHTNVSSETMI